jgi:hypothetical protein
MNVLKMVFFWAFGGGVARTLVNTGGVAAVIALLGEYVMFFFGTRRFDLLM